MTRRQKVKDWALGAVVAAGVLAAAWALGWLYVLLWGWTS